MSIIETFLGASKITEGIDKDKLGNDYLFGYYKGIFDSISQLVKAIDPTEGNCFTTVVQSGPRMNYLSLELGGLHPSYCEDGSPLLELRSGMPVVLKNPGDTSGLNGVGVSLFVAGADRKFNFGGIPLAHLDAHQSALSEEKLAEIFELVGERIQPHMTPLTKKWGLPRKYTI